MTNLVAGAVGGVHRNLQLLMALTERRYSQTWRRIRSAMPFPFRQCLPEIATAPLGPRNDKPLAFTVLSPAGSNRQYSAGRGMPLPYNARLAALRKIPSSAFHVFFHKFSLYCA